MYLKKMKKTSIPEIDTFNDFRQEFSSLHEIIVNNIASLARYERSEMNGQSVKLVEKLNTLKIHSKKLKDMLLLYNNMDEEKWPVIRPEVRKIFEAARQEYLKACEELSLN